MLEMSCQCANVPRKAAGDAPKAVSPLQESTSAVEIAVGLLSLRKRKLWRDLTATFQCIKMGRDVLPGPIETAWTERR